MKCIRATLALVALLTSTTMAFAQVTPGAGSTPPDDTPSIRVGAVIYPDYTFQSSPETTQSFTVAMPKQARVGVHGLINF
jgi:hypothetical protein